jgi:hypothetical protein
MVVMLEGPREITSWHQERRITIYYYMIFLLFGAFCTFISVITGYNISVSHVQPYDRPSQAPWAKHNTHKSIYDTVR